MISTVTDAAGAYPLTFVEHAVAPTEPLLDTACEPRAASQELLDDWLTAGRRGSVLVVLADNEEHTSLSFRNLQRVNVIAASNTGFSEKKTVSIEPTRFTCTGTFAAAARSASPWASFAASSSSFP